MSVIIIPRRHYTQPQGRVTVDWSNPLSQGLLVAATPFSEMAVSPEIKYGVAGGGARRGILRAGPVRHGLASSTVFVMTQALLPDDGSWWNAAGFVCGDTAQEWPADLGLRVGAPTTGGRIQIGARNTAGEFRIARIDVTAGGLSHGGVFIGAATIDSDLLVTGFGEGKKHGTDASLRGFSYNPPAATSTGPLFGQYAASGAMDFLSIAYRWGRVLADSEIFDLEKAPWQLFRADPIRIYSLPTGAISINSITASNIAQTGARITLGLTR